MSLFRSILCLAATAVLSACVTAGTDRAADPSATPSSFSPALSVPAGNPPAAAGSAALTPTPRAAGYSVVSHSVTVPEDLRVSEANQYYPIADIVWRGDPPGDRRAQIRSIFDDAFATVAVNDGAGRRVVADVKVARFHALTEKTRYSFGGVHSIKFDLTVRDAATGAVIEGPRRIKADVEAAGGVRALAEETAGRTQRVVIVEDLVRVLRRELGPDQAAGVARSSFAPIGQAPL